MCLTLHRSCFTALPLKTRATKDSTTFQKANIQHGGLGSSRELITRPFNFLKFELFLLEVSPHPKDVSSLSTVPTVIAVPVRCIWSWCYKLSRFFYTILKHSDTDFCISPLLFFFKLGQGWGVKYLEVMASGWESLQGCPVHAYVCCLLETAPG